MNKTYELNMLKQQIDSCVKCPELVASRTQPVFGDGNPEAPLAIIAESPGREENKRGIPFVGDAGELLDNIIKACGWDRQKDVYILNTIKCHPEGNRNPTEEESLNCRGYLDRQLDIIKPKYLLLLGSVATKALLGGYVSSLRGRWHEYRGIPAVVTFHPSYAMREGDSIKREMGKDLRMLISKMRS